MKKTKELENEETSVSMDKILKIESLEDAKEFERVASGRKFCKRGTRVQDICEEEVENYICKTRGNLLLRWQLDTVQFVVAPQTLYLGIGGILIQHHLAVFILGKLIK